MLSSGGGGGGSREAKKSTRKVFLFSFPPPTPSLIISPWIWMTPVGQICPFFQRDDDCWPERWLKSGDGVLCPLSQAVKSSSRHLAMIKQFGVKHRGNYWPNVFYFTSRVNYFGGSPRRLVGSGLVTCRPQIILLPWERVYKHVRVCVRGWAMIGRKKI